MRCENSPLPMISTTKRRRRRRRRRSKSKHLYAWRVSA
jgi:hypothetical protein